MFVQLDPTLGPLNCPNLAAQALDLSVTGDSGLYAMPPGIAAHRLVVESVADYHLAPVRPRPYQRHAALKHVQKLRQLIDTETAQETSDRSYARVVASGRQLCAKIGHVRVHRPELEHIDRFIVEADPGLDEQDRPRAGQANEQPG